MTPVTACGSQLSLIVAPPDVIYPDISLRDTTGLPGILILRPRATIDTVAFRAVNTAYICPETLGGGDPPSIISLALGKRISPSGSQLEIFHIDCNNTYVHTYMVRFFHDTFRLFYYSMSRGGEGGGKGTNLYWRCWIRITRTVCGIEMRTSNVSLPDYYFACVRCVWWKESFMTWLRNEAIDSNRSFSSTGIFSFINISYSVDASPVIRYLHVILIRPFMRRKKKGRKKERKKNYRRSQLYALFSHFLISISQDRTRYIPIFISLVTIFNQFNFIRLHYTNLSFCNNK